MITLNVRNPDDGTASYDKIKIYRATSQTGSYTLLTTISIDLTGATEFSTGYTSYTDSGADTTYWYEFSYYNSGSTAETTLSIAIQGGTAYLDSRIRSELSDADTTAPNYPFFTNQQISDARQDAVNALYPFYFKDWVDKTSTTTQNNWEYTIPPSMFDIDHLEVWDTTQTPNVKITDIDAFDELGNKIRLQDTKDVTVASGYALYIYGSKRILDAADVPSHMDEALIRKACAVLLRQLYWDRAKYQRYTTIIRPEGGNLPSISSQIRDYEAFFDKRLQQVKKGKPARSMALI